MAKRAALALGSGGARGYAHIGVIHELRERGYQVVGVAGSSMGALVGGLFAAGSLDEFTDWATSLTGPAMLRLLDPSITAAGVFRAGKIFDAVRELLGTVTIEELSMPYTAVTTDLIAGRSVWLQRGPLDQAIRASVAIPGVIAPYVVDGRLLADGGILDPLPLAPVAAANADLTVAVSVSGWNIADDGGAETSPTRERLTRLRRSTTALLERWNAGFDPADPVGREQGDPVDQQQADLAEATLVDIANDTPIPKLGGFAVMTRTIEIAQAALARHQMAAYPPDVLIEVPRTACRSLDFHRAPELIELGQKLAARALDRFDAE